MIEQLKLTLPLEGEMAEVGVWQGRSAVLIHVNAPKKILHLYDTFKGIVMSDPSIDKHGNGDFANTSVEKVKGLVGEEGDLIKYHVGTFPYTFTEHNSKFCFVHSDTDTYFGAKATLDMFSPRIVEGGKICFHDYKWVACPGIEKAISEFLKGNQNLETSLTNTWFTITF